MAAPLTKIGLANRALARFGAGAIQSFDQSIAPGPAVALLYDTVVDGLLAEYPWSFTEQTVSLQPIVEAPRADGFLIEGWRNAYALPANLLALPERYQRAPVREYAPVTRFEVQNQTVYCDEDALWAVCRMRVDEAQWPPYFVRAAVACLAAELVMSISGNSGQRDALAAEAWGTPEQQRSGGFLGMAKTMDARGAGVRSLPRDPLTLARMS
ncbi:MAG: hypothetical protein ACR650_09805 [Methylocystis sp.]